MHFQSLSVREKLFLAGLLILLLAVGALFFGRGSGTAEAANSCETILAEWSAEHPEDAAPKTPYTGEIAEVDFTDASYPQLERLKTGITSAVQGGANFAGHYAVVEWGCGSNCQEHAVVDVQSGKPVAFGIPSEAGLRFLPESNILITNPEVNFPTLADIEGLALDDKIYWYNLPREYYVLEEESSGASVRRICIQNAFEGVSR